MSRVHYVDVAHDSELPCEHRGDGKRITLCGYQRKETTLNESEVTCKICIRKLKNK